MIAYLHDSETVNRVAGANLSAGVQGLSSNSETETGEACPSVISLTLESFPITSESLLQDDPEWGEGRLSWEAPVIIIEPAQDGTGGGPVQEKEVAATLEGKQNWVNKELQQDSMQDMDPDRMASENQDLVGVSPQQVSAPCGEQSRTTVSENVSPMPAFQDLSPPACNSPLRSGLLVYSRRRQKKRQEARAAGVDMEVPALMGTLLTTNEGADTKTQAAGVTPRHSRRIARAKAECNLNELETRSRKKAMRVLSIIDEQGGITDQANGEYSKLFGKPLTDAHLEALANLFNW
jgi:hypothetical protein